MLLTELLSPDRVKVPLGGRTKDAVLRELVDLIASTHPGSDPDAILESVRAREQVLSTGIGAGIAIPHAKTPIADELVLAAGVAPHDVDFDALDGKPVRLFFLLVGPESASGAHVKALSRISRLLRRDNLREALLSAASVEDFMRVVHASETT